MTDSADMAADSASFADRLKSAMDAHGNDSADGDDSPNTPGPAASGDAANDADSSAAGDDPAAGDQPVDDAQQIDDDLFDASSALAPDAAPLDGDTELGAAIAERDGYLDALQRLKAEFDNHKRRNAEQAIQQREQAAASLVEKLLPVLDACEAALVHDADAVKPVADQLLEALGSQGLVVVTPTGEPFDPEEHEAVMHEPGDGPEEGPVVAEVLRTGYAWNGRVLRPAMVKVRG